MNCRKAGDGANSACRPCDLRGNMRQQNQEHTGNAVELVITFGGILYHQVNRQRKAGKGIAGQIAWACPAWRSAFTLRSGKLGDTWLWSAIASNGKPMWIASAYSQDGYGYNQVHTDYGAFRLCLLDLNRQREQDPRLKRAPLFMPYGIGCGLGGGDWSTIANLIQRYTPDAILVKLPA